MEYYQANVPSASLSVPAIKLDQISVFVMRSLFLQSNYYFFQDICVSSQCPQDTYNIGLSAFLWWSRSMAPNPGTCEGCWSVCLWTYVTSEAQAVEHVSTIDRNMFCWSPQTPLSQCVPSLGSQKPRELPPDQSWTFTLPTPLATDQGLSGFILRPTGARSIGHTNTCGWN